MADQKVSALSAITQADVDDSLLLYVVDVTGGTVSRKVSRANLFAGTKQTQLPITLPSAPTGSASEFVGGIKISAGTIGFVTTAQTGDYITNKIDQATLTNPSSGTVPNATSLKIVGSPIASTNVTITNAYTLWIAGGKSKFDEQVSMTSTANTVLSITPTSAPTGSGSEFVAGINTVASTVAFATTQQTGDFVGRKMGQSTLTNPSSGTITNASTLKITGAPIASTNVTITNAYALWVVTGVTLLGGGAAINGNFTVNINSVYAYFSNNTSGYPTATSTTLAIGNNFSAGGGDVDFWNAQTTATVSFAFYQLTGANTATLLASLSSGGDLKNVGNLLQGNPTGGNGYDYFLLNQGSALYPTSQNTTMAFGNNFSGGGGEITLWNCQNTATPSFVFYQKTGTSAATKLLTLEPHGSLIVGPLSALSTSATDGFLYIPSGAGAPTGVPTAFTGKIALYYDSTNNFLYVYNGGWKKSTVYA